MLLLYSVVFFLLTPFILLRLYWRGIKAPAYRLRWQERLACYQQTYPQAVIWLHAVSVGEVEAAFVLLKALQRQYPHQPFLITTTTPTGSARVQAVLGQSVNHVYLPYDLPFVIKRFLDVFQPRIAIILEKELWPNLFHQCHQRQIPLLVVNARLSERSARRYRQASALMQPVLNQITAIAAQTAADRQRFIEIGVPPQNISITGNIKFDMAVDAATLEQGQAIKRQLFAQRWVWIIASTHKDEERVFLELYPQLKAQIPNLLLLIVPRHPERFAEVKKLCADCGLGVLMRSQGQVCQADTDVYIADSIGELKMLYAAADLSFVGGSLVPVGGLFVLEAAAAGVPILFGQYMFNFQDIAERMLQTEAAVQCRDSQAIYEQVLRLYQDDGLRRQLAERALLFIQQNQGAVDTLCRLLMPYLPKP